MQKSEPIQPKTSNILPKFCQPTLSDVSELRPEPEPAPEPEPGPAPEPVQEESTVVDPVMAAAEAAQRRREAAAAVELEAARFNAKQSLGMAFLD